jgi:hypothetical protein
MTMKETATRVGARASLVALILLSACAYGAPGQGEGWR